MANETILGISLGTRQCGIVIMRGGTLIDWKVKSYFGKWSKNKLDRILSGIEKIIARGSVTGISCKIPVYIRTYQLDCLISGIRKIASRRQVALHLITIDELKSILGQKILSKEEYALHLSQVYPELTPILIKHKKIKTEYYIRVFEAVGAAQQYSNQGEAAK